MSGSGNPFYGKAHSEDTKTRIRESNRIFREQNKCLILKKRLTRAGMTEFSLRGLWEEYKSTEMNLTVLSDKSGVDSRTFQSLLVATGIVSKEEIRDVTSRKQLGGGGSYPEKLLIRLLRKEFGSKNVEHQPKRFGYFYDGLLFDNILIEYDGYYFHKILINKNDPIKTRLAKENDYLLIRIEEDEDRFVDFSSEIKRIKKIIKNGVKDEV